MPQHVSSSIAVQVLLFCVATTYLFCVNLTKQGSSLLRFLLVEAAQVTVRSLPEWRGHYFHLLMRRGRKTAKVAMARRLAVDLYWMWREQRDYQWKSSVRTQESPEQAMVCSQTPRN